MSELPIGMVEIGVWLTCLNRWQKFGWNCMIGSWLTSLNGWCECCQIQLQLMSLNFFSWIWTTGCQACRTVHISCHSPRRRSRNVDWPSGITQLAGLLCSRCKVILAPQKWLSRYKARWPATKRVLGNVSWLCSWAFVWPCSRAAMNHG